MAILNTDNTLNAAENPTSPSRGLNMTDHNSKLKICLDIASAIFILYIPFLTVWNHYDPIPTNPLPLRFILLIMDILPCVFGIVWLLYRYMDKIPYIDTFLNSPLYQIIGLFMIGFITILVLKYWR